MADKQELLARAVPDLLTQFVTPQCVDDDGVYTGASSGGECARGHLEHSPISDIHIGIVSSSLGGRGSSTCPTDGTNPTNPSLLGAQRRQGPPRKPCR